MQRSSFWYSKDKKILTDWKTKIFGLCRFAGCNFFEFALQASNNASKRMINNSKLKYVYYEVNCAIVPGTTFAKPRRNQINQQTRNRTEARYRVRFRGPRKVSVALHEFQLLAKHDVGSPGNRTPRSIFILRPSLCYRSRSRVSRAAGSPGEVPSFARQIDTKGSLRVIRPRGLEFAVVNETADDNLLPALPSANKQPRDEGKSRGNMNDRQSTTCGRRGRVVVVRHPTCLLRRDRREGK